MIDDVLLGIVSSQPPDLQAVDFDALVDARRVLGARDLGRIPIVDLSWLDGGPGPNPLDCKQGSPPLDLQDELVQLWVEDRPQVGGAWLVPSRQRPDPDRTAAARPADLQAAIAAASRRIHAGHPVDKVIARLRVEAGDRVAEAAAPRLRDDAGLAGLVFVRESAYPGLRAGHWDAQLQKMSRSAKYLLSSTPADGWRKFGLQVVSAVPWAQALRNYMPELKARGAVFASAGNPKEVLRGAVSQNPAAGGPSRRVPGSDPSKDRQAPRIAPPRLTAQEAQRAGAEKMGAMTARMLVRKGLLSRDRAEELIAAKKTASEVRAELTRAASRPDPVGAYAGAGDRFSFELQAQRAHGLRRDRVGSAPKNLAGFRLRKRVAQMLVQGTLTHADARRALGIAEPAAAYKGHGVHFDPRRQAARDLGLAVFSDGKDLAVSARRRALQLAREPADTSASKLRKRVAQMLLRGEIDAEPARGILRAGGSGWHKLAQHLASPGPLPKVGPAQSVVHAYAGPAQRAAPTYRSPATSAPSRAEVLVGRVAAAGGFTPAEVQSYLRWVRQAGGRGLKGAVLESEARLRFPEKLRAAAAPLAAGLLRRRPGGAP